MAETNFTPGGKETERIVRLFCSTILTGGSHNKLIYLAAFNVFLSLTAVLGNTLILLALRKESSLNPPSKLLLRCLAITDLCVGLVPEPLLVVYWMSLVHEYWDFCRYALYTCYISGFILCSVSLLVLTAISVDRLLAFLLRLRYRQVVTLKRLYVIVVTFWVVSTVVALCFLVNRLINSLYIYIVIPLSVVISIIMLHKDFPRTTPAENASTKRCSTRKFNPNHSTEHSTIQEGSVQRIVATAGTSCVLSTL